MAGGPPGPQTPINSGHPGGGSVLMGDGSTHYLVGDQMDLPLLFRLADRADGQVVDDSQHVLD